MKLQSQMQWALITVMILSATNVASAGDIYVTIRQYTSDQEVAKVMESLGLKWKMQQSGFYIKGPVFVTLPAGEENEIFNKLRESDLTSKVHEAYVSRFLEVRFKDKVPLETAKELFKPYKSLLINVLNNEPGYNIVGPLDQQSGDYITGSVSVTIISGDKDDVINKIRKSDLISDVFDRNIMTLEIQFNDNVPLKVAEEFFAPYKNLRINILYRGKLRTRVAVSADDDIDMQIRDLLIKQSIVEQAYVVISTRKKVNASGKVIYLDFEGGFWGVLGDDGEHYLLVNMPEKLEKHGLRLKFSGKPLNVLSTSTMSI